ncbi:MAG: RNA-binding protein [Planctomycetota bacterium]
MNIYVGNLAFEATEESIRAAFSQYGQVGSVSVITDRETGRPRGFAFVEMADSKEARQAIDALNNTELAGRTISVSEARPKTERPAGGRRGGGGFGGGGRRRD